MRKKDAVSSMDLDIDEQGQGPKRLLVITPFSPLQEHGHAADDLGPKLVDALAMQFDVYVYAPGQSEALTQTRSTGRVTYFAGSDPRPSLLRHFGWYPAGLRKDWSRKNSREVRSLIRRHRPDLVHVEYLQGAEAVLRNTSGRWSITLHDITSTVFGQKARAARGLERAYRMAEYFRVALLERRVAQKARHVFALSARDAEWVKATAAKQSVSHVRIGIDIPATAWSNSAPEHPTFVFAGAMWRDSNVAAAEWLAKRVMPMVWQSCPTATLRIVGDRPTARALALASDSRIDVVGKVASIEDEYLRATAVLAPTLVDAGVLLKALRGFACGAPLIMNTAAAEPLEVQDGIQCFVKDTPELMANQMIDVWMNPQAAQVVASVGAAFVRQRYSWTNYGREMIRGIGA